MISHGAPTGYEILNKDLYENVRTLKLKKVKTNIPTPKDSLNQGSAQEVMMISKIQTIDPVKGISTI